MVGIELETHMYSPKPPGVDARIHQRNDIGNGEMDRAKSFVDARDEHGGDFDTAKPPSCSSRRGVA